MYQGMYPSYGSFRVCIRVCIPFMVTCSIYGHAGSMHLFHTICATPRIVLWLNRRVFSTRDVNTFQAAAAERSRLLRARYFHPITEIHCSLISVCSLTQLQPRYRLSLLRRMLQHLHGQVFSIRDENMYTIAVSPRAPPGLAMTPQLEPSIIPLGLCYHQ